MKMQEKGKKVQQQVALRRLETTIRGEEEKLQLKKERHKKMKNIQRIAISNKDIHFLEKRLELLYEDKHLLEQEMQEGKAGH